MLDPIAKSLNATKYDTNRNDYFVDCANKTMGNMEFTFGKFKVVLTPSDYLLKSGVSIRVQSYLSHCV